MSSAVTDLPNRLLTFFLGRNFCRLCRAQCHGATLNKTVWEVTMTTEVEKGFVAGLFESEAELRSVLASQDFVCSRRFAIMQSAGGSPSQEALTT